MMFLQFSNKIRIAHVLGDQFRHYVEIPSRRGQFNKPFTKVSVI